MSDTYELDPDFAEPKPKRTKQSTTPPTNTVASNVVLTPVKSDSVIASFYEQNKTLIIIAIAVVIVLVICLAYWYFSKSSEPVQAVPPKKPQLPDNVPPPNLEQIPMARPTPPPRPIQNTTAEPTQDLIKNQRPITHEDLVANTDDAEIDKYMNPEESTYEPEKEPKSRPVVDMEQDDQATSLDKKADTVLDDLEDLEDS